MSLTIFNGSPRGKNSNSSVITNWFLQGYKNNSEVCYLNKVNELPTQTEAFVDADEVLMVFPLYVDGMPGQVKAFFETLLPHKSALEGKKITYIIHSGFSEGLQNIGLETYLRHFSTLMSLDNRGIVIIPGSEGFRLMPPSMTKKKSEATGALGEKFATNHAYSPTLLKILNPKNTMSKGTTLLFKLFSKIGLTNIHWNRMLKQNNCYDKRFDAPYSNGPVPITTKGHVSNY